MWRRGLCSLGLTALTVLALGLPALAGGWAVSTLDALPADGFRAGQTYQIGYTIRQHGQTPYAGAQTAIVIRSSGAKETYRFAAAPSGPVGHYLAEVRFPTAGEWTWQVDQSPFEPQALGTVTVEPAVVSEPATAAPAMLPLGGLALVALVVVMAVWRAAIGRRGTARIGTAP